jgi:hypothetical protein
MKKVAVVMGSDSDLPVVKKAIDTLEEYGVPAEVHVYSAHRTPEEAGFLLETPGPAASARSLPRPAWPRIWPALWRPTPRCL